MSTFQSQEIQTYWFSSAKLQERQYSGYDTTRMLWESIEDSQNININLSQIFRCWKVNLKYSPIHEYVITSDRREYHLYSDRRVQEFEEQFPFFPYNQSDGLSFSLAKIAELEKQNTALISHVETILIYLRMRGITDDNLDFKINN